MLQMGWNFDTSSKIRQKSAYKIDLTLRHFGQFMETKIDVIFLKQTSEKFQKNWRHLGNK